MCIYYVVLFFYTSCSLAGALDTFWKSRRHTAAEKAYTQGDLEHATQMWHALITDNPEDTYALYNLGCAEYKQKNYEKACAYFESAARSSTEQRHKEQALFNLGNSQLHRQNLEEAQKNYEQVLTLNSQHKEALHNLAYVKQLIEQQKRVQEESQQKRDNKENKPQDQPEQTESQTSKERQGNQQQGEGQSKDKRDKGQDASPHQTNNTTAGSPEQQKNNQQGNNHTTPQAAKTKSKKASGHSKYSATADQEQALQKHEFDDKNNTKLYTSLTAEERALVQSLEAAQAELQKEMVKAQLTQLPRSHGRARW